MGELPSDSESHTVEKAQTASTTPPAGKKEWKTAPFVVKPGPNYGHRLGQSMKRWWPLHLFIVAAVTLLITLPLVYVGFPNISQGDVNDTEVSVDGLSLTEPTVDSFLFGLNSTLRPKTSFEPTLDAFNVSFQLVGAATPFAVAPFPSTFVHKPTSVNISEERIRIQDPAAWSAYLKAAFANDTYSVRSFGNPGLKLGALPHTTVNFDKTIDVPGLGGLKQMTVQDVKIRTDTTKNNFMANVTIFNPSNSVFDVGNVTYRNYIMPGQVYIGDSVINNLKLQPGNNTFATTASTQQQPVVEALGKRPACQTGFVETLLVPVNVTYHGAVLPFYISSLANVTESLPLGQAIQAATKNLTHFYCPQGV